jgi:hypothetical protein
VRDAEAIIGTPVSYTLAKPMAIMAYYNHWRRSGRSSRAIDPLWGDFIRVPMKDMVADIYTNPQGLVSASGRFGDNSRESGAATYPMAMAVLGALRGAAIMADAKKEDALAKEWRDAADILAANVRDKLYSAETSVRIDSSDTFPASDMLPETRGLSAEIPSHAIVYGRFVTGSPLIYSNGVRVFDSPYVFAGVTMASDILGSDPDEMTYTKLTNSLRYVMSDSALAALPAFKSHRIFDYQQADLNTWAIQAALCVDANKIAGDMLTSMTRFTYDELVPIPAGAGIEISPWTFEDDYNLGTEGENQGALGDDLNAYNGTAALHLARLIAGIDDADVAELKVMPRLPDGWNRIEVKNWQVCHNFLGEPIALLDYSFESYPELRYSVKLEPERRLKKVTVRVGPFEPRHLAAAVVINGVAKTIPTTKVGLRKYVYITLEDVGATNISVQPQR